MPPVHYHHGKFPPPSSEIDWEHLVPLIGPATIALGEFKGLLDAIPNPMVLLSPLSAQEAVLSSRIEGTQATLGEVLEYEAGGDEPDSVERKHDIQEVLNYRKAIAQITKRMDELLTQVRPPSGRRPAIYAYGELLNIAEGKEVFSGS